MSWTDIFPVLTNEMLDIYEKSVTPKERALLDSWFNVKKIYNRRRVPHIITTSLFWKNIKSEQPNIIIKNRRHFIDAGKTKKILRFKPWDHYVKPLIEGARMLSIKRDDVAFRVYLAADLEFLVADLVAVGCEVRLMETSSIRHNPGAMWRFLAFEERNKLITNIDADRADRWESDVARTEEAARLNLGWWRVPVWGEQNEIKNLAYRPILGCQFGANKKIRAKILMKSLIWHTMKGLISTKATPPGCSPLTIHGSKWPDYGFDEWFLQTAVYPRAAFQGVLTFIPSNARSRLLPLDIEYIQWANPKSELVYFGNFIGCCAPPPDDTSKTVPPESQISVSNQTYDVIAYTYRSDCGLGEAAVENIRAMREIGLTVDHRIWNGIMPLDGSTKNPNQLFYHHWHPQPGEVDRVWKKREFGNAKHIAYWAYETTALPKEFLRASKYMEEIWVPSTFCRDIFMATGRPIHIVPHCVSEIRKVLKPLPSHSHGGPLTVLFLFDAWSRMARKNPEAILRVFRSAFGSDGRTRLIIKAHHLRSDEFSKLHQLCGREHWITIVNEFLPEKELIDLFEKSDLLLSLQRSEGFGLNLARALAMGLPVVTTGFGGHLDFCKSNAAFLVPYEMERAANHNDSLYRSGLWANPNESVAVSLVKEVAEMIRLKNPEIDIRRKKGLNIIKNNFTPAILEATMRKRIAAFPFLAQKT